ncbi:MAG: hypothetical protein J7L32_05385 [Thermoplasmata archaeon]|nr:hypothetical protein [Thermoplasmata archaeon]
MNKEQHEIRKREKEEAAKNRQRALEELERAELKAREAFEEKVEPDNWGFRLLEIWGYAS